MGVDVLTASHETKKKPRYSSVTDVQALIAYRESRLRGTSPEYQACAHALRRVHDASVFELVMQTESDVNKWSREYRFMVHQVIVFSDQFRRLPAELIVCICRLL